MIPAVVSRLDQVAAEVPTEKLWPIVEEMISDGFHVYRVRMPVQGAYLEHTFRFPLSRVVLLFAKHDSIHHALIELALEEADATRDPERTVAALSLAQAVYDLAPMSPWKDQMS